MAASYNPDKVPPPLSDSASYQDWRKIVDLWGKFTSCPKEKQGMAVIFTLKASDQKKVLNLSTEVICGETGLESVLKRLDELYLEDETLEMYSALEDFESYKRVSSSPINDFLIDFELKYDKIKSHGITYPEELLGFRLLKAANLPATDEKLAKATSDLKYPTMKAQLKRLFSEKKGLHTPPIEEINYQEEETLFSKSRFPQRGRFSQRGTPTNWRHPNSSTSWRQQTPQQSSNNTANSWRQQTPSQQPLSNKAGGPRQSGPFPSPSQSKQDQKINPLNNRGTISTCGICKSIMHWASQCPHNPASTLMTDVEHQELSHDQQFQFSDQTGQENEEINEVECEIILFQADYDSPTQFTKLLSESFNLAVIDCGASKTVCGRVWLNVLLESLSPDQARKVSYESSDRVFKFGDGRKVSSQGIVKFPAVIGTTPVTIEADIVDTEIPLLFSRQSLKKAGMIIDFKHDTAFFLNQKLPLSVTSTGHYILPITQYSLMLSQNVKSVNLTFTMATENKSKTEIALKLHRQFAHAPAPRIVKLLKSAQDPWCSDKDLFDALDDVSSNCETCRRYKTPLPRPVVGLPMATKFQETVAMDIKHYDGQNILHIIDHATRLSTAKRIPNKRPETIVKALLNAWISVYGPAEKFLTDNGGEFVNPELITLAESFGIIIKTTGAEAPWSNGLVERHNRVLSEMLDKIIDGSRCNLDVALAWAMNAKNCLATVHGFSPYQLVLGRNPVLPSTLNDKPPALQCEEDAQKYLMEHLQALHIARQAFIQAESSSKIRQALNSNVRSYSDAVYSPGDLVYYKRLDSPKWKGPASVLGKEGQQVLLKHGGHYIRVHPCRLTHVNPQKNVQQNNAKDRNALQRKHSPAINAKKSIMHYDSEDEEAHVNESSGSIHSNEDNPTPSNSANSLPTESIQQNIENLPRISNNTTSIKSVISQTDKSLSEDDNSIPQVTGHLSEPLINEASLEEQSHFEGPVTNPVHHEKTCYVEGPLSKNDPKSQEIPNHVEVPAPVTKQNELQVAQGHLEQKLTPNDIIEIVTPDSETLRVKLHSRSGKVGKSGNNKWSHSWNVLLTTGELISLDLKRDVTSWLYIGKDLIPISDQELITTEVYQAEICTEIEEAKAVELEGWKKREVYDEVDDNGQSCISVRWVITPKVIDGKMSTKARLVAKGFQEIQNFRTDSPTCSRESLRLMTIIIASNQWQIQSIDVKQAFLQGRKLERSVLLRPPPEAATSKLWHLRKCIYGLADAPREFYLRLREELVNLGLTPCSLDQGLFMWYSDGNLGGILICHVDDLLFGGNEQFCNEIMHALEQRFEIGTRQSSFFAYIGVTMKQLPDSTIVVDQKSFTDSIQQLVIDKKRKSCEKVTEEERTKFRAAIGQLNWIAGMTRPDLSFDVCQLSSIVKQATIADMMYVNKVIKRAQMEPLSLAVPSLDLSKVEVVAFADASYNNLPEGGSQGGNIIFLTDGNKSAPLQWSSSRIRRVVRSTLAAESLSASNGCDSSLYLANLVNVVLKRTRTIQVSCYTDNKSLFDSISTTKPTTEQRLRLDISALREMKDKDEVKFSWIKSEDQLSDCLTKKGASTKALREVLGLGSLSQH